MSRAQDKKKSLSRRQDSNLNTQTPGGRSIHLSYGELMESEALY